MNKKIAILIGLVIVWVVIAILTNDVGMAHAVPEAPKFFPNAEEWSIFYGK